MIDWQPKRRVEQSYQRALAKIFNGFLTGVLNDPPNILSVLRTMASTPAFRELAFASASRMATSLFHDGATSWRAAAKEGAAGQRIFDMLRQELNGPVGFTMAGIIEQNAQLISTFPGKIADEVANYIAEESIKGRRASAIAQNLQAQFPDIASSRIALIARTETSKASTALTRARAKGLGLNWYRWTTSHDARVRDAHAHMSGVLINWNDPPSPEALIGVKSVGHYAPGDIWNCRCYPAPIIHLDRVNFPAKVYTGGKIKLMKRLQFERITD